VAEDERPHQPDKWGNLPGGEVFTTPGNVEARS
jgi:leucyl aminopeptidase (aminopeptidase T)